MPARPVVEVSLRFLQANLHAAKAGTEFLIVTPERPVLPNVISGMVETAFYAHHRRVNVTGDTVRTLSGKTLTWLRVNSNEPRTKPPLPQEGRLILP